MIVLVLYLSYRGKSHLSSHLVPFAGAQLLKVLQLCLIVSLINDAMCAEQTAFRFTSTHFYANGAHFGTFLSRSSRLSLNRGSMR